MSSSFIATADWQLGMAARFLGDEARARFQQARFDMIRRIGEVAAERQVDFVVVCGDVFEDNYLHRRILLRTFEALRSVPVPVYLLPGNHDPLDAASIYDHPTFLSDCPEHVTVIRDTNIRQVAPGIELVGAPWFTKFPTTDLAGEVVANLPPVPPGTTRVLAAHGAVSSLSPDPSDPAIIDVASLTAAIDSQLIDLVIVGDRHSTTEVARQIWYPGAPEVTDRIEVDSGNVLVVQTGAETPLVETVRSGQWSFTEIERDLYSQADVERLRRDLERIADKETTALWLSLRGTLNVNAAEALEDVIEHAQALFARAELRSSQTDLSVLADNEDFRGLGLTGYGAVALERLRQKAEDGDNDASGALSLLHRLARGLK